MNYILFYSGRLPKYYKISINNILSVDKDAKIFFCSDEVINSKFIRHIFPSEINHEFIEEVKNLKYFENENNPLWLTSLLRIYYLLAIAKKFRIEKFIHFDLDVMIYKPYSELENLFHNKKFNITPMTEVDLIFGYSFVSNLNTYYEICSDTIEILKNVKYYELKYNNSKKINEMMLLNFAFMKNPENFNLLNTYPNKEFNSLILFDPQQYGQYLSGIDKKILTKHTVEEKQYIGREVLENGYKIKFLKNKPYLISKNNKYEIANLHIHKKTLERFKNEEYICYLK